jgi:hypothetical protein
VSLENQGPNSRTEHIGRPWYELKLKVFLKDVMIRAHVAEELLYLRFRELAFVYDEEMEPGTYQITVENNRALVAYNATLIN